MKKTVYVETSIVSYLTAKPSQDIRAAAWQQMILQWWDEVRPDYELFISELVTVEAAAGDAQAASRRTAALAGLPELPVDGEIRELAESLIQQGAVPAKAAADALHIAIAAVHDIDYWLTWNFRHIDNAVAKPLMRAICANAGYRCAEICTPPELFSGEENHVSR
jgi:hypothetical protein